MYLDKKRGEKFAFSYPLSTHLKENETMEKTIDLLWDYSFVLDSMGLYGNISVINIL